MMGHADAAVEMEKQVIEQLAIRVLNVPGYRYKATYGSKLMLANHQRALVLLNLSSESREGLETESCDICSAPIAFTDYTGASCSHGHKFRRCALTLLAVQAPGICKFCDICGKQYLKATRVESQQTSHSDGDAEMSDGDAGVPLTELLSAACDRCVYCGGKFIG
jgi:hypothetical protein